MLSTDETQREDGPVDHANKDAVLTSPHRGDTTTPGDGPDSAVAAEITQDAAGDLRPSAEATRPRTPLSELWIYLATLAMTSLAVAVIMRLWRATWEAPFFNRGDAVASAAHFRTTLDTGWYEFTAELGAPYGQHYHDFPFSDDLHPAMAKLLGLFTDRVGVVFNVYYILGFLLAGLTATWFLRRCGMSPAMTVAMSVLYAVAPYHFIRNEGHLFLASYYCVPLALGLVLAAVTGKPLWGRRANAGAIIGTLTGRSAGTVLILILITYSAAYYAVFTGVLLAAAGLFAFLRDRRPARLGGVMAAGAVLGGVLIAAMLPDILYAAENGSDAAAFIRSPGDAETYSLKFAGLILPAPSHRIPAFAALNTWYNTNYPLPGELPSLGAVAAVGFVFLMLIVPVAALASRRSPTALGQLMRALSFLTYVAFITATVGGLSTLVSLFLTDSIRGWNRMSIFISLLGLAAVGLLLDQAVRWLRTRPGRVGRVRTWISGTVIAAVVLIVGIADQSLIIAVPNYQATADEWRSNETFVRALESSVPADSMIFQLPNMPFPESPASNGIYDSDQLSLYLHASSLRWSGGGIKGRPQSDWPGPVSQENPDAMTRDLATVGFEGIVVDRAALADAGAQLDTQLTPLLGPAGLVSPDQRYAYYSLQPVIDQVMSTATAQQRDDAAQVITHVPGGEG